MILHRTLFRPEPSLNLGIFRTVFCGLTAFYFVLLAPVHDYVVERDAYWPPWVDYYHFNFAGVELFSLLRWLFVLALLLSAAGIFTRASLFLAAIAHFFYEFPIGSTYMPYTTNMIFYVLIILAASPGVDDFGVTTRWRTRAHLMVPAWPFWTITLMLGITYFCSFLSKIRGAGWQWADGKTLQVYVFDRYLATENPLAQAVAQNYWLCLALALGTLFFEATFWIILVVPRLTVPYVLTGIAFHTCVYLIFDLNFIWLFCTIYFVFPNWAKLFRPKTTDRITSS